METNRKSRTGSLLAFTVIMAALVWADGLTITQCLGAQSLFSRVRECLRNRIESSGFPAKIIIGE
ncbi:MAG: hypothetical protein JSU92_12700 [Deltaproteobacteria bacterium]|nr:MAG: hypothetical protein JSU92_12700 [Deltaproteobacteria bacterium]